MNVNQVIEALQALAKDGFGEYEVKGFDPESGDLAPIHSIVVSEDCVEAVAGDTDEENAEGDDEE